MLRFLKVFSIVLLVIILIAGIAVFVFIKIFDVNQYKDKIAQQITAALGRSVSIDRLALNITGTQGLVLEVKNFIIHDDPILSSGSFLSIQQIFVAFDLTKLAAERKIAFSKILLKSPQVVIIRDDKGVMNIPTGKPLPELEGKGTSATAMASTSSHPEQAVSEKPAPALPELNIKTMQIEDGQVTFRDQMQKPAMNLVAKNIGLKVNDFSLTQAFPFELAFALFSGQQNIHIQGKAQIDAAHSRVQLAEVQVKNSLASISLSDLAQAFPQVSPAGIEKLNGEVVFLLNKLSAGQAGIESLDFNGELGQGEIKLKTLPTPIKDIAASLEGNANAVTVSKFTARIADGTVSGDAKLKDYLKGGTYTFNMTLKDVLLEQLAPPLQQDIKVAGKLNGQLAGQGGLAGAEPLNSLSAQGKLDVQDGKLVNLNILKVVLEKISLIPNLYDRVYQALPDKYKEQLNSNDTVFQKIDMDLEANKGVFAVPRAELIADVIEVAGKGSLDLQNNLQFSAQVAIPKELSTAITAGVKEFSALVDDQGRIVIPLKSYSGKVSSFTAFPDMEYLGKKFFVSEGRGRIEKLLDKAFGKEESPASTTGTESAPAAETEQQKRPERQIIENVLGQIFNAIH